MLIRIDELDSILKCKVLSKVEITKRCDHIEEGAVIMLGYMNISFFDERDD